MAECSESDGELFITHSKYSSREKGSDTDTVLSGILDLEQCIQRDVSEDLFSDILSIDEKLLSSTLEEENELLQQRFPRPLKEKDLDNMLGNMQDKRVRKGKQDGRQIFSQCGEEREVEIKNDK